MAVGNPDAARHGHGVSHPVRADAGQASRRHAARHARRHDGVGTRSRPTASTCSRAASCAASRKACSASKATIGRTSSWFSSTARPSISAEIGGAELHELSVAEGFNVAQDVGQRSDDVAADSRSRPVRTKSRSRGASVRRASKTRGSRVCARRSRRTTRPACRGSKTASSKARTTSRASARRRRASACSFAVPPARPKSPRAPSRSCRRSRDALSAAPSTPTTSRRRSRSTTMRGPTAATSTAVFAQPSSRMLVSPWFLFRVEGDSPDVPAGSNHADQRFRARVAAVVLPLVEHPRRRAARLWRRRASCASRRCSKRKCAACSRIRVRDAMVENFVGQWLQLRNLEIARQTRLPAVPGFRRQPAQGVSAARPSCCSRTCCAKAGRCTS